MRATLSLVCAAAHFTSLISATLLVPLRYIVEFDSASFSSALYKRGSNIHTAFSAHLQDEGVQFDTRYEYASEGTFVGASVSLQSAADYQSLVNAPHVKNVWPVSLVDIPTPIKASVNADVEQNNDTFAPHIQTNVSLLHDMGILGDGIHVAIIDTGVDYTHPALGGCFGKGCKVFDGYDLVGDNYDGSNTPVPSPKPMDCAGHGTHVSGIVAADYSYGFNGVAPKAKISMWRVFGCKGGASDDVLIAGALRAQKAKPDVITLSLGGPGGWTSNPFTVVISRIVAQGIIVTVAAGNAGEDGLFYASSPSGGTNQISVASVDSAQIPTSTATTSADKDFTYYTFPPFGLETGLPIYVTSPDDTTIDDDACKPLPDSTPDLSNYIVIVRRGTCYFNDKAANVAAKGAKYILIYNNEKPLISTGVDTPGIQGSLISSADGLFLVDQFNKDTGIKIKFPKSGAGQAPSATGGQLSLFTAYGPNFDLYNGVNIAGVGGSILSTWPTKLGKYAVLSGTSMATPQIAGIAALYLSKRGKIAPLDFRNRLSGCAQPVAGAPLQPFQPVARQGAGLANAYCTIFAGATLSKSMLNLNDTAYFKSKQSVTIKNSGKSAVHFKISHKAAGTANAFKNDILVKGPVGLVPGAATVKISAKMVTVPAAGSVNIDLQFSPPKGVDAGSFPVYSGYILFTSTDAESLVLPYHGVAASMINYPIIDTENPPVFVDYDSGLKTTQSVYSLKGTDVPTSVFRLTGGTKLLTVELVSVSGKKKRSDDDVLESPSVSLNEVAFETSAQRHRRVARANTSGQGYSTATIIGRLAASSYLPRDSYYDAPDNYTVAVVPTIYNNKGKKVMVKNGNYKLLFKALKISGNAATSSDWEESFSKSFTVKRN